MALEVSLQHRLELRIAVAPLDVRGQSISNDDETTEALRAAIADAAGRRSSGSGAAPCYSLSGGQPKIAPGTHR